MSQILSSFVSISCKNRWIFRVNMEGRLGPERIVEVIDDLAPDLVALQEVDVGMSQTGNQDQAKILGERLGMDYRFFPVVANGSQKYGLAILSRFPFQRMNIGWLPTLYPKLKLNLQKRGIMWAILKTSFGPLHFFNTHLSLYRLERRKQLKVLLGTDWLMAAPENEPVIFCGDLNTFQVRIYAPNRVVSVFEYRINPICLLKIIS